MDQGTRLLIYSHDSFGLGHLRRCRAIAHHLVGRFKQLSVLILSGSPIIGSFDFRSRVDFVRVPGVIKLRNGEYTSPQTLRLGIDQTLEIRRSIIHHTAEVFEPDVFLVDKEPLGLRGEVRSTLEMLKARGTRCVLGLRDVMDEPARLVDEWERKGVFPALANIYDDIWVYGLPRDLRSAAARSPASPPWPARCTSPAICAARVPETPAAHVGASAARPGDFILVTPGGGGDGAELDRLGDPRLRARSRHAAPRRAAARAVHAGRAAARLPGAGQPRPPAGSDHLRGAGRAVLRARPRHRRRWAATTRSARSSRSASRRCWCRGRRPGSSSICAPSGRSGWASLRMLPRRWRARRRPDGRRPARAAG